MQNHARHYRCLPILRLVVALGILVVALTAALFVAKT